MNNNLAMLNPTGRFTNRVENYTRYRPGYPEEVIHLLRYKCKLTTNMVVADVGSGTGIFSELLLKNGYEVYCVEPNKAMREEAERRLAGYPRFKSMDGAAERTGLQEKSVDLIVSAQAFHWFDAAAAKQEFGRILKHGGAIALLWNLRINEAPQMVEYEQLKKNFGEGYALTKRADTNSIQDFFGGEKFNVYTYANNQLLDFAALKGQLLSASYMPTEGHARYNEMITALDDIFTRYSKNGLIEILQETKVYLNR